MVKNIHLDDYEKEIEYSIETEEWQEDNSLKEVIVRAARRTLKSQRINIRMTEADLTAIKEKAANEGIPYQTLISSLIHSYVTGQLQARSL